MATITTITTKYYDFSDEIKGNILSYLGAKPMKTFVPDEEFCRILELNLRYGTNGYDPVYIWSGGDLSNKKNFFKAIYLVANYYKINKTQFEFECSELGKEMRLKKLGYVYDEYENAYDFNYPEVAGKHIYRCVMKWFCDEGCKNVCDVNKKDFLGELEISGNQFQDKMERYKLTIENSKKFTCKKCGLRYRGSHYLRHHTTLCKRVKVPKKENQIECELCCKRMMKSSMKKHLQSFPRCWEEDTEYNDAVNYYHLCSASV